MMSVIIDKNDHILIIKRQLYTTIYDDQEPVGIKVYEGEEKFVKDNTFLNWLDLAIPPKPNGEVKIIVSFKLNENAILEVSAQDAETKVKN